MLDSFRQHDWMRTGLAVLIALAGAVAIWTLGPYNNYFLSNTNIVDGFLPVAVLCFTLVLVLLVNPLLRAINPSLALSRPQLAMIVGILLVATVVPGQGLMRTLPHTVVRVPLDAASDRVLAQEVQRLNLPEWTWPEKIEYGADVWACERYRGQLDVLRGEQVPWAAWGKPLMVWGSVVLFSWLLMVGLATIVMPQWRDNERLAFPLLRIQEAMIAEPGKGHLFAAIFRSRRFWIAVGLVLVLRLLNGFSSYYPESVPAVPLRWNVQGLFTEEPWVYLSQHFYSGRLYFLLIGIAFFMPNRTSLSMWIFVVIYFLYEMVGKSYFPPYHAGTVREHRLGALVALSLGVLWLGRKRWGRVLRTMFTRARDGEDRQDRIGGYMFAVGVAGVFAWLVFMGVQPGFAVLLTGFGFMTSLVVSRAVAETGLPYFKIRAEAMRVVRLFPAKMIGAASLFFSVVVGILFTVTTRTSAAALSTHALALNEDAGRRNRGTMALLLVAVLLIGLLVSGAMHLHMNYHHAETLDGKQPINSWGYLWIGDATWGIKDLRSGSTENPQYSRLGHVMLGFAMAAGLFALCLAMPRWPLHPIGLLFVGNWMGYTAWPSIMIGWLIKQVMVRYGGARLYRSARPFFLGLIIGEVFAALAWTLIPILMHVGGQPYKRPEMFMLF